MVKRFKKTVKKHMFYAKYINLFIILPFGLEKNGALW
jgi:hypothetical protein